MGVFLAAQAVCLDPVTFSPYLWSFFLAASHASGLLVQSLIIRRLPKADQWNHELREIGESYTTGLIKSAYGTLASLIVSLTLATLFSIYRSNLLLLGQALTSIGFLLFALLELERRWRGYMGKIGMLAARPPTIPEVVVAPVV